MRIAIFDPSLAQAEALQRTLAPAFKCHIFDSPKLLLRHLRREIFDLALLDWNIQDIAGFDMLTWVRTHLIVPIPVIFMTDRTAETDIVACMNAGADDYVIKPLRSSEVIGRVTSVLRKSYPHATRPSALETHGSYVFDITRQIVTHHQGLTPLTRKECDLALLMFRNVGRPLSREYIHEMVWGAGTDVSSRTMDTHLSRVRTKLAIWPENGYRLESLYSFGYRLDRAHASQAAQAA